jgi:hypothetical protein
MTPEIRRGRSRIDRVVRGGLKQQKYKEKVYKNE